MDAIIKLAGLIRRLGVRFGGWAVAAVVAFWFFRIILDEDRSALYRARVYKALFRLTGRVEQEKKYISNDITARLNLARRATHHGKDILPRAVDVRWAEGDSGTAQEISEGKFVVRLDPSDRQEKNIALIATAVVERTALQGIRHSIEAPVQAAIDLNLTRLLLRGCENKASLDYFLANEYGPLTSGNALTKAWSDKIVMLDERGLFTRILLVEIEDFARRIYGMPPRPYMTGEIEGLIDFLYGIANKKRGQEVPLQYHRAFIRVAVIIVARTSKILTSIEPYVLMMHRILQKDFFSIYVLAYDKEWLGEVDPEAHGRFEAQIQSLKHELQTGTTAVKDIDLEFSCTDQDGNTRRARCIRYLTPPQ